MTPRVGASLLGVLYMTAGLLDACDGVNEIAVGEPVNTPVVLPASNPTSATPPPVDVVEVPGSPTAHRGDMQADGPPPAPQTPPPGDCGAWGQILAWYGATELEVTWFLPILERESGCGQDTLNDATGDSGICQIAPIHNNAGWFGGHYFADGGWLHAEHQLTAKKPTTNEVTSLPEAVAAAAHYRSTQSIEWADACLTLYRVCGSGAWTPPYSCTNNPLGDMP